jgi:hypothetical protein
MTAQATLFPLAADYNSVWLSDRCCIVADGDVRVVVNGGAPLIRYDKGDAVHERFAAALVVESGAAKVGAVLAAFAIDDSTLFRARERFREDGIEGLVPTKRGRPAGHTVEAAVVSRVVALRRGEGLSPERIGERLGLSRGRVRRILAREGVPKEIPETLPLTPAEDPSAVPDTVDMVGAPEVTTEERALVPEVTAEERAPVSETLVGMTPGPETTEQSAEAEVAAGVREPSAPPETQEIAAMCAALGATLDGETEVVFESGENVPMVL